MRRLKELGLEAKKGYVDGKQVRGWAGIRLEQPAPPPVIDVLEQMEQAVLEPTDDTTEYVQ